LPIPFSPFASPEDLVHVECHLTDDRLSHDSLRQGIQPLNLFSAHRPEDTTRQWESIGAVLLLCLSQLPLLD